ncbi:MAG: ATP-dependent DNA helicase [Micavibrio aeruginosavorus]|uniref:ATP-dependent DNA helicase n=1 Tax=Micavibrio aeruginosavorus TaxID=349221 RepID=A0A7T5UIU5_9BACT|nr:MAG: ATP-dependent DNA helicase [Micavibrio aeruginosavorus]
MNSPLPQDKPSPNAVINLPDIPVLCVNASRAAFLSAEGELEYLSHEQARLRSHKQALLVCHAPYTRQRLGTHEFLAFDILELFSFVHPATFCVPTPAGVAKALGLTAPDNLDDYPFSLTESAQALLEDISREQRAGAKADPADIARVMGLQGKGWPWTPFVMAALGVDYNPEEPIIAKGALSIWKYLPEWSEDAPPPPATHHPVTGQEGRDRLSQLLQNGKHKAEPRPQQQDYTAHISSAFSPAEDGDHPHLVIAEAGTGVGKTLGYLAPASVWAEKNKGPVWIATYTKNLQRQIDQELDRLYPDPQVKAAHVAIRKGRENYLCLLNLDEIVAGAALAKHPDQVIAAGLMCRWAERTKDGDLSGGDFPGWLPGLIGAKFTLSLADRRGECIFSACDHYHRCFVERSIRRARRANLVIANHALVMAQAAMSDYSDLPSRYVFDEGHHLFDAADSAFAGHLTARETSELRRWLRGAEGGRGRARGLKRRVEDLIAGDADAEGDLESILHEASSLAAAGWSKRLKDGDPVGVTETFLSHIYKQVFARADDRDSPYSLETDTRPLIPELSDSAFDLKERLTALRKPMISLSQRLKKKLADHADTLDSDMRRRLESVSNRLNWWAEAVVGGWIGMLETLEQPESPPGVVDWMEIERIDGQAVDIGLYRHWIDPMKSFAESLKPHAHGIVLTSATLRDGTGDETEDWRVARERTGADHLNPQAHQFSVTSPFDYPARTKILIVNDVRKDDMDQVAAAYRTLFQAADGGGLGLFTAIQRLRAVYDRITTPLEENNISLYAQHVDNVDTGTLVDIFREEKRACLLGTDAVRDGIDVPGEALRVLVYDRVPWPRPTILHRARREAFGGRRYDELITRLKLRQAFGRLVRRADDRGIFVMLDSMLPSRMLGAFPPGVAIERVGLAQATVIIRDFYSRLN